MQKKQQQKNIFFKFLFLHSLNNDKLTQSPFTGQFFLDDDILLWYLLWMCVWLDCPPQDSTAQLKLMLEEAIAAKKGLGPGPSARSPSSSKQTSTRRIKIEYRTGIQYLCTGGAYCVPYSWFLISFVMGGSGPSRANKFLYAPAPPPPSVWALNLPRGL